VKTVSVSDFGGRYAGGGTDEEVLGGAKDATYLLKKAGSLRIAHQFRRATCEQSCADSSGKR
jgi:hypothetical protein